jgi:hypothetical protein
MHVLPYANSVNGTTAVQAVTPNSPQEQVALEALCSLGYLALLVNANNTATGNPQAQAAILAAVQFIESNLSVIQAADPAAYNILVSANVGSLVVNGQVNPQAGAAFLAAWQGNGNSANAIPNEIAAWMAGQDNGGVAPFNLADITDPNTMFAYTMFATSLYLFPSTDMAAQAEMDKFFEYGTSGPYSGAQVMACFLTSYVRNGQLPVSLFQAMFPQPTSNEPGYASFYNELFGASSPYNMNTWQPPSGESSSQVMFAAMELLTLYLPNN